MNRDELIEEAAKAITFTAEHPGMGHVDWPDQSDAVEIAKVCLAVYAEAWSHERTVNIPRAEWERLKRFEQANTPTEAYEKPFDTSPEPVKNGADSSHVFPTGDEREAPVINYCPEHGDLLGGPRSIRCNEAHAAEDVRRTVQGEPTTRPHCEGCAKYEHHHCYHCGKRAGLPHATFCPNYTEVAEWEAARNDVNELRAARAETWDEAISAVFAWWSAPEGERPALIVNPYGAGVSVDENGSTS